MPGTADLIARALKDAGVRHAFGIPGGEVLDLVEAFRRAGIRFVLTRQELGAGFMADATYQLTGVPGVLVATLGPGLTNAVTPIAQALLDRSAMIAITGDVSAELKPIYTHQVFDQCEVLRPLVKWTTTVSPRSAGAQVRKALDLACSPMPGPVHLNLPTDVAVSEQPAVRPFASVRTAGVPASGELDRVVRWLRSARRPMAFVGLAVQLDGAGAALRRFLERWRVPCVTTYKAKGVLAEDHPLAIGAAGLSPVVDGLHAKRLRDADLVLTIGFDPVELRSEWISPWDADRRTVSLDLVPNTHHVYRSAIEWIGSIAGALDHLTGLAPARAPRRWPAAVLERHRRTIHDAVAHSPRRGLGPHQVAARLREVFPRDTIATVDTGSHRILVNQVWRVYEPRRFLQSNGLGSMGYALPAAIAAQLLFPKKPVLAMMGEAGLDMVSGELALLARHELPVTIVVFRDDVLSLIRLKQERMKLAESGVTLAGPDYATLAKAYGGNGYTVRSVRELEQAAGAALRSRRFTLIEAQIDPAEYRKQM
jgi:acetolactate synthase I/II/III large subunit